MDPDCPDIESPGLAAFLEAAPPEVVDRLPYGVIRLDAAGMVTLYSARERELSGYRKEVLGRRFFADIAPCLDNPGFSGRIERARAAGRLDVYFDMVGDLPGGQRDVAHRVRLVSASDGGTWVVMQREE